MHLRGRSLRYTAVTVLMVLALTGFSTSRGHGHKSSDGDGGGCSSSSQDHDSSSGGHRDYDDDDDSGGSSGGSGGSDATPTTVLQNAEVRLISCATEKTPYATVTVTNPNATAGTFSFDVTFVDEQADTVARRSMQAYVPANNSTRVNVDVDNTGLLARVDHCQTDSDAEPVS
ncbi:hypothetical protein GR925_33235 [Streptomyces sp. HUCO-GS316]|nr:hypothetical protein [Streptomyces sp. HUCO-GS316]MXM68174.1 hypothetical protein [Streptomyces sp. HUCO-GS316]